MQVVFTKDVQGVARRHDVREVKEGFARNYLVPQGLAVPATPQRIAAARAAAASVSAAAGKAQVRFQGWAVQLQGKRVTVSARANASGTLYAGVGPEAVAAAVREQLGIPLEPVHLELPQHLKAVGEHAVAVTLGSNQRATLTVVVTAS